MIIAIDIETAGLNAQKFLMGCLLKENHKKAEYFKTPKELWKRILELAKQEEKNGKLLTIYSHNAQYDTAGYIPLNDKNLRFFCNTPFIWSYVNKDNKEIIKFLDTMNIYKGSLKWIGEMIGLEKLEMPQEYFNENTVMTKELFEETKPYIKRDCEIVIKAIQYIKEKLKEEGIMVRRLLTKNQIAINYIMRKLREQPEEIKEEIFWNEKKNEVRRTFRADEIHSAYRGGRVEAFKIGNFENITYIDCNSLYPYSIMSMEYPKLKTERKFWKPTMKEFRKHLQKVGISRIMIENRTDEIGCIPIRTKDGSYFIRRGQKAIGTWTHIEINEAIQNGYKMHAIEWTVTWDKMKNPFKKIIPEIYERRIKSEGFNKFFYKTMMNNAIGKMAQRNAQQEIKLDTVEMAQEYLIKNYEIMKGIGTNYMYKKDINETTKPYYMPIIPCQVNAYARIYMYKIFKRVGLRNLIYTDTDSVLFKENEHRIGRTTKPLIEKFKIGNGLGEFKMEHNDEECLVYGKKNYMIGEEMKASGVHKSNLTPEQFTKGEVEVRKMITIKTCKTPEEVGTFETTKRNLNETQEKQQTVQSMLEDEEILIDNEIQEINYFIENDYI